MATPRITKGENGYFYATWFDKDDDRTKRFSLKTKDEKEALKRFASFITEGPQVYVKPSFHKGPTLGEFLDQYVEEHAEIRSADPQRTKDAVKRLKEHFGNETVEALSIPMCRLYTQFRQSGKRPVGLGTIRRELGVLVAALNHAVRWKRLPAVSAWPVELPVSVGSTHDERWLTPDELRRLRDAAGSRVRDFIDVAYFTGARRDAVLELTVWQVKLDQGLIYLAKPGERQTRKRKPVVPIDPMLMPTLTRLVNEAKERGDGLLFPGGAIRTAFEGAVERAALNPPRPDSRHPDVINAWARRCVTPHTLRHTRATHLLQAGKPIYAVAKLLGDLVSTVEKTYGHHSPSWVGEAISREEVK